MLRAFEVWQESVNLSVAEGTLEWLRPSELSCSSGGTVPDCFLLRNFDSDFAKEKNVGFSRFEKFRKFDS